MINVVKDYGWASDEDPHSCDYIVPRILEVLSELNAKRILDLGSWIWKREALL